VPEISRFFGIVITMYHNDHAPPHFHARYGGREAAYSMEYDVVEASLGGYRLFLGFADGVSGELDFAILLTFEGVFAALRDPDVFAQVRVDPELGTIVRPGSGDYDPHVLHAQVRGREIPEWTEEFPKRTSDPDRETAA
jgi:hypothetical protein